MFDTTAYPDLNILQDSSRSQSEDSHCCSQCESVLLVNCEALDNFMDIAGCMQSLERGIRIRKEDVRILLSLLDPVHSQARLKRRLSRRKYFSQGPNFIWHVDGYDKLKPYGICINGCIDGYSRRIIWLKAAFTNSDPKVIGSYFVEAIENVGGYPRLLRTDMGTENVLQFLRRNDEDDRAGERSYITGASTANQRIESWWGVMRKEGVQYWIQQLGELKDEGLFTGIF
ncbi:hypothetical protein F7725_005161 [Dissostichus mawsoni]|uniref:Integrase core domain-containing protein n=1 Tax=Dissostichus mawsoni TaxID=36200 RepID=A0A7J5YQL2_DISMA|nr:hypothetical protein F7725_005161 [Dissostichus mawsoni]